MDHILENKFLSKEQATKVALMENDDDTSGMELISGQCVEEVQFQVFESFVKEKYSLLGYIRGLVAYSIKQAGFEESVLHTLYPGAAVLIKQAKTEQDLVNFKNRIIIIVSFLWNC